MGGSGTIGGQNLTQPGSQTGGWGYRPYGGYGMSQHPSTPTPATPAAPSPTTAPSTPATPAPTTLEGLWGPTDPNVSYTGGSRAFNESSQGGGYVNLPSGYSYTGSGLNSQTNQPQRVISGPAGQFILNTETGTLQPDTPTGISPIEQSPQTPTQPPPSQPWQHHWNPMYGQMGPQPQGMSPYGSYGQQAQPQPMSFQGSNIGSVIGSLLNSFLTSQGGGSYAAPYSPYSSYGSSMGMVNPSQMYYPNSGYGSYGGYGQQSMAPPIQQNGFQSLISALSNLQLGF